MVEAYIRLPKGHSFGDIDFLILNLENDHILSEVAVLYRALKPVQIILSYFDRTAGPWYKREYKMLLGPPK